MADVAYSPPQAYNEKLDTAISKTQLLTGIMLYGQRILLNGDIDRINIGTNSNVIYTVPDGYTLFICNTMLDVYGLYEMYGSIWVGASQLAIMRSINAENRVLSQSFTIPITAQSTEKIKITTQVIAVGYSNSIASVGGYLVANTVIPTFI